MSNNSRFSITQSPKQYEIIRYANETLKFLEYDALSDLQRILPNEEIAIGETKCELSSFVGLDDSCLKLATNLGKSRTQDELLKEIICYLKRVVQFKDEEIYYIVALWILATYVYDQNENVSYLAFVGSAGGGKSRALNAVANLAYNTIIASGADTDSMVVRSIDNIRGSIAMDEAQKSFSDKQSDWHKILCLGNQKGGSIGKNEFDNSKKKFIQKRFNVFGPKAFAGRSVPPEEAISSRTIEIHMPKISAIEAKSIQSICTEENIQLAEEIKNALLLFRQRRLLKVLCPLGNEYLELLKVDPQVTPREFQVYQWLVRECSSVEDFKKIQSVIETQKSKSQEAKLAQFDYIVIASICNRFFIKMLREIKTSPFITGEEKIQKVSIDAPVMVPFKEISNLLKDDGFVGNIDARGIGRIAREFGLKCKRDKKGTGVIVNLRNAVQLLTEIGIDYNSVLDEESLHYDTEAQLIREAIEGKALAPTQEALDLFEQEDNAEWIQL